MKHLLPLLALGILPVSAQSISTDDAHQLARQFFTTHAASGAHHALAKVEPVLAYTATTASTPDFYVFNRAEDIPGFVIVNADATSDTQILGYCESSTFDYETAPDNFKWWLEQYQTNGVAKAPAKAPGMRHDVDYLCKTKWNQDAPYWNSIPYYGETPYVTGCAATSMAQVMKYFNYPDQGVGSHSYTSETLGHTYSANFAGTTYDWANMLDDYSNGYDEIHANAVATLMYHCGVAQDMNYNTANKGGSGAYDGENGKALMDYFKYDKSMLLADRLFYSDEAWEEMIYNEIINGRPILYSGQSTGGGHSFICDGYRSSDQTYHFNWGWGGYCDGYYALTGDDAIAPNGSGIGGSSSSDGYTSDQCALINIIPDEGGKPGVFLYILEGLKFFDGNVELATNSTINLNGESKTLRINYRIGSNSFYDNSFEVGIELRHKITEETHYIYGYSNGSKVTGSLKQGYCYTNPWSFYTELSSSEISNGVYEVYPAFCVDGVWHRGYNLPKYTMPTIVIEGSNDPIDIDVPFTISDTQVMVGKSLSIAYGDYYNGAITYESSNPKIASVSNDGVVTGVAIGKATITARAEAIKGFNATTKTFDIDIIAHVMQNVDVTLDKQRLMVGETANISLTKAYDGDVTYTVAPEGIVSVSADGLVTALAEGDATITVNVAGNYDFRPTTLLLDVSVSNRPANTGTFEFADYPTVGDNNIVTDELKFKLPVINNASEGLNDCYVYYSIDFNDYYEPYAYGIGYRYLDAGDKSTIPLDLTDVILKYMTPDKTYTIYFYSDSYLSVPMNVPSLTFYYAPEDPAVGNVSRLISDAKNNKEIKPQLIKTLVSKVLKK